MRLKSLVSINAGHPIRESIQHNAEGELAVVQMKDVDVELGLNTDNLFRINTTGRKHPDFLKPGDILFVSRGYRIFAVMIEQKLEQTIASPHFFILRVQNDCVTPEYLTWFINCKQAQKYFSQHLAGSALPHVNRTTLENLPITIPPPSIQEKIVNMHRCHQREKRLYEQLISKKQQLLDVVLEQTIKPYQEDKA